MYGAPFEETQFITAKSQSFWGCESYVGVRQGSNMLHHLGRLNTQFLLLLEGFVRRRIAATAVLAVGLALGTAGCTFLAPQATAIKYNASDGVSLNVGDVQLRNAFVISPKGTTANLIGVLINSGDSDVVVHLQYRSDGA